MRLKLLPIVLFWFLCLPFAANLSAQESYKISGIINDNYNKPLPFVSVQLNDTSGQMISGASTDANGNFIFINIKPGNYKLFIQFLGFQDENRSITIKDKNIDLGLIKMRLSQTQLKAVTINGRVVAVEQNGDTTSYNAKAYKVNPDANAQDLIKKMPGMDMSSGTPKAQGETVTKVLVDNKPFFGNDATTALQNLPADIIQKVQVYDEKSDQAKFTGFDDGNTTKTINIITKPGDNKGVFGKLFAGYGNQNQYNAGGDLNFFNGNRRISLIGMSNNVNIQNFSPQDLIGISSGGGRGRSNASNNFLTNLQSGIAKTNAIGINYSDNWGKKITVTGSYFFNNSRNESDQEINRLYVLPAQTGQSYLEDDTTITYNYNHRFNLRLNYNINSNSSILFVPTVSFQKNSNSSKIFGRTLSDSSAFLNSTDNNSQNKQNASNYSGFLLVRHKFQKKGRTLSVFANGSISKNTGKGALLAENDFNDTTLNNLLNQSANNKVNNNSIRANVNYTEPISKKSYIQIRYGVGYQSGESNKYTNNFSPLTNDYSEIDTALTNAYNTNYLTNSLGLAYRISVGKMNASIGTSAQNAQLQSDGLLPEVGHIHREYDNLLPYATLHYKFSKTKDLGLFYRTNTDAPSVDQLQNVVNNQNPLQLSTGNPLLKQDYQHNLRLRFRSTNVKKSISVFGMLSGNYIQDYIGNSTFVASKDTILPNGFGLAQGGRFTTVENLPSYWNVNAFTGIGMPINFLQSNLNINMRAGYESTPGKVNDAINYANNTTLGFGVTLSSNISEKIDFTFTSHGTENLVKNTVNTASNNQFYNQTSKLSANFIFWKGIVLNSDITNQFYTGLSSGYNQNYYLWNASIAKKIFKKQQGELKFSVYDILGQNQAIERTVSEIYSQDVRTNVLQRYFMLTFTYTLKDFKGKAPNLDENNKSSNKNMYNNYHNTNHSYHGGGWH